VTENGNVKRKGTLEKLKSRVSRNPEIEIEMKWEKVGWKREW